MLASDKRLIACVERLSQQPHSHIMASHVMAPLGNQPDTPVADAQIDPDPIAIASMQNLIELTSMMNYN